MGVRSAIVCESHVTMQSMAWFDDGKALGEWTLGPPLTTFEGHEMSHIRTAHHEDGREGVVKGIRGGRGGVGRARLENEIVAMRRLNGTDGVLPVLASSTSRNAYLITPRVLTLREHLGRAPDLRQVVEAIVGLAETLAMLHVGGTFHRDLKPENLFWHLGRAVLGDFGLVLDPTASNLDVTAQGDMVGSIYFMAPEARSTSARVDWGSADVYSLAMCMWVLARGTQWPPHSTLWAREPDVSLYYEGSNAAFDLAALLQMATEAKPRDRLRMDELILELRTWLRLHPVTRRVEPPKHGHYFGRQVEARAAEGGIEGRATRSLDMLAGDVVRCLPAGWGEVSHEEAAAKILHAPDITRGDPDWTAEWGPVAVAREFGNVPDTRLVLELVGGDDESGYYLAEWQVRRTNGWKVAWRLERPPVVRPRFPSDRSLCMEELAPQLASGAPPLK